jgi:hypothetical protein
MVRDLANARETQMRAKLQLQADVAEVRAWTVAACTAMIDGAWEEVAGCVAGALVFAVEPHSFRLDPWMEAPS